ncbi:MAG: hypothetical protein ABSG31_12970 [Tepidisphaeraceae bacterium]|jgi:hypothetical protein
MAVPEDRKSVERPAVLSYASIPRASRWRRPLLAMKSAAQFAGLALFFGASQALLAVAISTSQPGDDLDKSDAVMIWLVLCFLLSVGTFIVAFLGCLISVSLDPSRLERRKWIWPLAALYVLGFTCLSLFLNFGPDELARVTIALALTWLAVYSFVVGLYLVVRVEV